MEEFHKKTGASKLLTVVFIILGILVGAGGVWYYMDKKAGDDKAGLQSQVDMLTSEVAALKSASTSTAAPTATTATDTTADATAGWKTYTNSAYGFSFKYPVEYTESMLSSYAENDGAFVSPSAEPDNHLFSVEAEASEMTLSAYLAKTVADSSFSEAHKITFAGKDAYEGVDEGLTSSYGILVKNGKYVYHIVLSSGSLGTLAQNKAALTTIQNQILTTFQFTN